jgi:MraZ protein
MSDNAHGKKFLGAIEHGVDDKRRVQVPAKWRPAAGEAIDEWVVVYWHPEGQAAPCLQVFPPVPFKLLWDRVGTLSFGDAAADALRRSLAADADMVMLDAAGRICLQQELAEKAGITRKVVLVGLGDRFQMFSPENYQKVAADDAARRREVLKLI